MDWLAARMKWVMLVSGALTCTMLYAAIAPQASLQSTFGESVEGPVAEIVTRNWGVLITLVGAMLVYGARFLSYQPGMAVTVDGVMVLLFAAYLWMHRPAAVAASPSACP